MRETMFSKNDFKVSGDEIIDTNKYYQNKIS